MKISEILLFVCTRIFQKNLTYPGKNALFEKTRHGNFLQNLQIFANFCTFFCKFCTHKNRSKPITKPRFSTCEFFACTNFAKFVQNLRVHFCTKIYLFKINGFLVVILWNGPKTLCKISEKFLQFLQILRKFCKFCAQIFTHFYPPFFRETQKLHTGMPDFWQKKSAKIRARKF